MEFEQPEQLNLTEDKERGYYIRDNKAWYYGRKLTEYQVKVRTYQDLVTKIQIGIGLAVAGVVFFLLFQQIGATSGLGVEVFSLNFWLNPQYLFQIWLWVGLLALIFVFYLWVEFNSEYHKEFNNNKAEEGSSEPKLNPDLSELDKKDLAPYFTEQSNQVIDRAYKVAVDSNSTEVTIFHLFYSLLENTRIQNIFIRLRVPIKQIKETLQNSFSREENNPEPELTENFHQTIFRAFKIARSDQQDYIDLTELVLAAVQNSANLQEFLYDLEVDKEKLDNVIKWVRIKEKLRRKHKKRRQEAAYRSNYGIDRAMTAVATPFLNKFSKDITLAAQKGRLEPAVARDKEIEEIFRVIKGGRQSVLLTGQRGVGKETIINGIAQKIIEGSVPERLEEQRVVKLSISELLAGTTVSGAQKRLIHIMNEIAKAGNVILFIEGINNLVGASTKQGKGMDVAGTLSEYLSSSHFLTFATTTSEGYSKHIANTPLDTAFSRVEIDEMNTNQAIQVLESKAGKVEYRQNVFFSYGAIEQSVKLADKFFQEKNLPESAMEVIIEAASYTRSQKGDNSLVTDEDVAQIVSDKTGVKVTSLTEDESEKLMRLEEKMHERIVGQNEAVDMVSDALRRARANIRSEDSPIATFLFIGPTGVGKTELAKTISSVYFGGEDEMTRIDMSEFQDNSAINRLIGEPNQQGTGLLTEQVRENPFSLLLLDELEKASKDVLNIFLQVFDDGHITDSTGRKVDFTNTIIIATSNAGTEYIQQQINQGEELDNIKDDLISGKLQEFYPPEFLNRFDGIVLFKSLTKQEVKEIADLMLDRVRADMENKGVELKVTEGALESLADKGYDKEFGARPMQRAIQDNIENKLAQLVLKDKLDRRDTVTIKQGFEVGIEKR
jgi:ATP-dependent Clp protease ATP-binding subunit ClpC